MPGETPLRHCGGHHDSHLKNSGGLLRWSPEIKKLASFDVKSLFTGEGSLQGYIIGRHSTWLLYVDVLLIVPRRSCLHHILTQLNSTRKSGSLWRKRIKSYLSWTLIHGVTTANVNLRTESVLIKIIISNTTQPTTIRQIWGCDCLLPQRIRSPEFREA